MAKPNYKFEKRQKELAKKKKKEAKKQRKQDRQSDEYGMPIDGAEAPGGDDPADGE